MEHQWFKTAEFRKKDKVNTIPQALAKELISNMTKYKSNNMLKCAVIAYLVHHLTNTEECLEASKLFIKIDLNSDGKIEKHELIQGFQKYWGITEEEAKEKIKDGVYKAEIGDTYVYKELGTDKMLPINWSLFKIPKGETIVKIEIELSTTAAKLGKWQGAFGSSTGEAPDYWIMTDDMEASLSGTSDTVTWEVSAAEAKAIQTQTTGQLKFGVWWIDCGTFTIETCTVYTDASE